jgi:cyclic pyranopterin phosphate synthase
MVDVGGKADTEREAVARGEIIMKPETLKLIKEGCMSKGDVLGVARVAGIMAVKETGHLIPMAHPILITGSGIGFRLCHPNRVEIEARVRTTGKTGVEMEALTAVSVAALTIYDMCKAVDKGMTLQNIRLVSKTGGKSGIYKREEESIWEEQL